jgi:parvulin-like peptidyl-prolyl isomerase
VAGTEPSTTQVKAPAEVPDAPIPKPTEEVGKVLAVVGEVEIGSKAFEQLAARKSSSNKSELSTEEKTEALDTLITEEVLYQEAARRGLYRDPKVRKMMVNLLLREQVYARVRNQDFKPEELQAYFDEHRNEFVVPEKIQLKRIFIRSGDKRKDEEARQLATEIHGKLVSKQGEFADLAAEYSEDPYKRRGGDLGYISAEGKPGIDPAVVEKAFTMNVKDLTAPFEAGGGYNILLVASKRERVERTFDQMKGSVLRKLKSERYKDLTDEYIANTKASYDIAVKEEVLENLKVDLSRRMSLGPDLDDRRLDPPPPGTAPDLDAPDLDLEMDLDANKQHEGER